MKVSGYWEEIVPQYDDNQFRRTLRLPRSVFAHVVEQTTHDLVSDSLSGRPQVEPDKKLAVFCKYIGSRQNINDISQLFNIQESTVISARRDVTYAILHNLQRTTIRWPTDLDANAAAFNGLLQPDNFPGIIGALDGSHIPITTPLISPDSYFNRKKFHSIILQGVVDNDCYFIDVNVGSPGRMHDARVFRHSQLAAFGYQKTQMGRYHIIADAAYPLMPWLMTPFKNVGNLTPQHHQYNTALSVRRQVVERTFGMFKQRFRRLKLGVEMRSIDEINDLILACCVLYNLCIAGDERQEFADDDEIEGNDPRLQPVPNHIQPRNILQEGKQKRTQIMRNL